MTRYPAPPEYNLEGMSLQEIWLLGFDKGWKKAMEHGGAYGDEHDENCPICGVDSRAEDSHLEMEYEDRFLSDEE